MPTPSRLLRFLVLSLVAVVFATTAPRAVSPDIVISQVYGGGGNSGAPYTHDFVELFNRGTAPASLAGWSIQYASATGTGLFGGGANLITVLPSVTLQPGQYYLVQQAGGANGVPLPTPDLVDSNPINMAAGAGKVALVASATGLGCNGGSTPCSAEQLALIVDLVGYGGANFFEGSGAAPTLSNTTAAFRANHGCTDTDDNAADFTAAEPAPRNTASTLMPCIGPSNPTGVGAASPSLVATGGTSLLTVTVTPGDNPPSTGLAVAVDLTAIGGAASQPFFDDGTNGDVTAGDGVFSFTATVTGTPGLKSLLATITDAQSRTGSATIGITIEAPPPTAATIVVSQVYGGGGNAGATYTHDFVELRNQEAVPVTVDGWSIQYASATGSTWNRTDLTGTIPAHGFYLIQQAAGAGGTTPLPQPDAVGNAAMAAGAGKVALVFGTTSLTGTCPTVNVVDFVGYGSTANCFEGSGPTPAPSNTNAVCRAGDGSIDTNDNASDFAACAPAPRNTKGLPPSATGAASPTLVLPGDSTLLTVTVTPGRFPDSTGLAVAGDLTAIGGATTQIFLDDGTNGDEVAGDLVFSYLAAVPVSTTTGTKVITATIADAETRSATTTFSLAVPTPPIPIHTIQGDGLETPLLGQQVTTRGIVTGVKNNGFFIQTPDDDADDNPLTSEGLFVFTSTMPAAMAGDNVLVTGTATEFFTLTQIASSPGSFEVLSSGHPLPAPVVLTPEMLNPAGAPTQLEHLEGMRVHAPGLRSVAPTNQFGEIDAVLDGVPRPMREPGIGISAVVPPDPVSGMVDCCIPRWDENPERLMVLPSGLAGASGLSVTSNTTLSNVTGPLDFTFGRYKVLPEAPVLVSSGMTPVTVPAPASNEFTVGSFNIQNFANDPTQRQKAAYAIRNVMRSPDVVGVIEILNLASLEALADRVNADALAAGEAYPGYVAYLVPASPTATQNVGFLVRSTRVAVQSVTQELADETFEEPGGGGIAILHDRPPLVLRATVSAPGLSSGSIIVVVNHTRSFINIEPVDGDGPRVREKRTKQAESLARLLQQLQQDNPATPIISVGDYNAFEFNDGYTDPISVIKGTPTPDHQVVVQASPDLVDPDFVNLTDTLPPDQRYTYVFEGTPQALDHVLVNTVALAIVQRYAIARTNADFPNTAELINDPTRPERNSDHDMPVAYFAFPGTPVVTLNGAAVMTVEAFTSFTDPGATAQDASGPLPVTVSGAVDVNVPGDYVISYSASNLFHTTTVTRLVQVRDTVAPVVTGFTVTPDVLEPPNHQMVPIAALYTATDASGEISCTLSVTSNEAQNGIGDGSTPIDWIVTGPHTLELRAERSGRGQGRVYTVTVSCSDPSGNIGVASGTVTVPR
jgi:uncharacterized protein